MSKLNSTINLIQRTTDYIRGCSVKSILQTKPQNFTNADFSSIKLAGTLNSDVAEISSKPKHLIDEVLGKDLNIYIDKSADIGNPQKELLSHTYANLKTPEERALYRDVLLHKYPFSLQCEFFNKFYEPDISPKEQLEFIKKYIALDKTYLQKIAVDLLQKGEIREAFFKVSGDFNKEKLLRFALKDKEYGLEYIDNLFHKYIQKEPERLKKLQEYSQIIDENLAKQGIKLEKIENPVFSSKLEDLNPELYHEHSLYHGSSTASRDKSVRDAIAKYGFSQFSPGNYSSNSLFTTRNRNLAETFGGCGNGFLEFKLRKEAPILNRYTVCEGIPIKNQDSELFNSLLFEKGIAALNNPGWHSEIQIFDPEALTLII